MQVANTLAYYDTAIITAVKSLIVQALGPVFKNLYVRNFNKLECIEGLSLSVTFALV
jgi:hypothetical protein